MSWKGRIIGTIIGLFFGGVGAIVGFALGYFLYDKPRNQLLEQNQRASDVFTGARGRTRGHEQIIESNFRLMGYVSRGAGRINESHIKQAEYLMDLMKLNDDMRARAINAFNYGKSDEFDINSEGIFLRQLIGNNASMISYLMEMQVGIAIADDVLDQGEHERLLHVGTVLGVDINATERLIRMRIAEQQFARFAEQFNRQRQRQYEQQGNSGTYNYYGGQNYEHYEKYGYDEQEQKEDSYDDRIDTESEGAKSQLENAYTILGITPDASWDDVRRAHKKMMLKYHPDRLASQELSEEGKRRSNEMAQKIQAAYALIKASRGKK